MFWVCKLINSIVDGLEHLYTLLNLAQILNNILNIDYQLDLFPNFRNFMCKINCLVGLHLLLGVLQYLNVMIFL